MRIYTRERPARRSPASLPRTPSRAGLWRAAPLRPRRPTRRRSPLLSNHCPPRHHRPLPGACPVHAHTTTQTQSKNQHVPRLGPHSRHGQPEATVHPTTGYTAPYGHECQSSGALVRRSPSGQTQKRGQGPLGCGDRWSASGDRQGMQVTAAWLFTCRSAHPGHRCRPSRPHASCPCRKSHPGW